MALENNLGVQADRLGPQIQTYAVAEARAAYGLNLTSTTLDRSATSASNRLSDDGADNSILSTDNFSTGAGIQQVVPWGGGRYTVGIDASRLTTNNPTNPFNPQLDSSLAASYTQPLLRNFRMDGARQNLLQSQKGQEIADVQLRQTLTQTSRSVRNAYFNLVNAIGQLQVAQQVARAGADLAQEQQQEGRARNDRADRHRAGGSRGRTNRGAGHRGRGSDPVGGGRPARPHHEPLAAGLLDDQAGAGRAADARAAAAQRRRRDRQRAGQSHRSPPDAQADGTDRHQHEVPAEPEAPRGRCHWQLQRAGRGGHAVPVRPQLGDVSPADSRSVAAQLQRCAPRRLRQRLQDLERRRST